MGNAVASSCSSAFRGLELWDSVGQVVWGSLLGYFGV